MILIYVLDGASCLFLYMYCVNSNLIILTKSKVFWCCCAFTTSILDVKTHWSLLQPYAWNTRITGRMFMFIAKKQLHFSRKIKIKKIMFISAHRQEWVHKLLVNLNNSQSGEWIFQIFSNKKQSVSLSSTKILNTLEQPPPVRLPSSSILSLVSWQSFFGAYNCRFRILGDKYPSYTTLS